MNFNSLSLSLLKENRNLFNFSQKIFLMCLLVFIFCLGFGGGAVRSIVGYYKSLSFDNPKFDIKNFLVMVLLSGFIGLIAAVVTKELDISILGLPGGFTPAVAFLVGYAGGDLLDNLYKIFLRKTVTI